MICSSKVISAATFGIVSFALSFVPSEAFAQMCARAWEHSGKSGHTYDAHINIDRPTRPWAGKFVHSNGNLHENYWERRRWGGHIQGWKGHDLTAGDQFSSIEVYDFCGPGFHTPIVYLHEHANFGGKYIGLYPGVYELGSAGWDNKVSSIQCVCHERPPNEDDAHLPGTSQPIPPPPGF